MTSFVTRPPGCAQDGSDGKMIQTPHLATHMSPVVQEFELTAAPGSWRLSRRDPAADLAGVVVEYWEVRGALSAFRENLLPNGCAEVMVNLGPAHRVIGSGGSRLWERAWYSGLQERAITIESLDGTHLVSARLHPLGAVTLLGERAARGANSICELNLLLVSESESLRAQLLIATTSAERFDVLEAALRRRLARAERPPEIVRIVASRIERTHGAVRVASLHGELGVSRKHVAVSFLRCLGISAKRYASIHRFMWALGQLRERDSVDWSRLAVEAGYSDQSHLARDFRRVGAATPSEYLLRRTPDSSALLYEPG